MSKLKQAPQQQWKKEYEEKQQLYKDFETKLKRLIEDILRAKDIDIDDVLVGGIHSRTKDVKSFVDKIERKSKEGKVYADPLKEMTDLVGIRLVTYYKKDIEEIKKIIREEFLIDEENSIDKLLPDEMDKFGYASFHYIVSTSSKRSKLTDWKRFKGIKAEIQIRTVLQHAWASIDHKIRYKTITDAPKSLRRKLFRLSALLELADDEFYSIKEMSDERTKNITASLDRGDTSIEIDIDSIGNYLSRNTAEIQKVAEISKEAGFRFDNLPYFNRYLLLACNTLKLSKMQDIITRLYDLEKEEALNALKILLKEHSGSDYLSLQGIIIYLLMYNHPDDFHNDAFNIPSYEKGILEMYLKASKELKKRV